MADTDIPGFNPDYSTPPRSARPIASPFGMLSNPWAPPDPNQAPGFNVQPDAPTPPPTNPMSSLLASLMPSQQALKQGVANTLGAPVDMAAWALHAMGLPISGDKYYGGGAFNREPVAGQPTWTPSPSVPFGSQNIRAMMDNAPSWAALLQAARRPGLF
jgi:hypothetical protein